MRTESFPSAKTSMKEAHDKVRAGGGGSGGAPAAGSGSSVATARYVVQLGTMRNNTGQRADLDTVMRSAARTTAGSIKNAFILDSADPAVLSQAAGLKIPVLLVHGNLTKLSQTVTDKATSVTAQVELSIIRVPGQTIKGTVGGSSTEIEPVRGAKTDINSLQDRAVNSAVRNAMSSMGSGIALLAK